MTMVTAWNQKPTTNRFSQTGSSNAPEATSVPGRFIKIIRKEYQDNQKFTCRLIWELTPPLSDWMNDQHEIQLANTIEGLCDSKDSASHRPQILQSALKVLIALMRRPATQDGYKDLVFQGEYFHIYPINLKSFLVHSSQTWNGLTVREWIRWLSNQWGVKTHFMVALRKLRGQSQSTFRIRPSDYGLEVISVPKAVFTMPRFNQSIRILKDIGALKFDGKLLKPSVLGHQLKETVDE